MANYKSLRRYYLIVEKLRGNLNTSFKAISSHLEENDIEISERTLQRDIAQIRVDFGVDILYNKTLNSYTIDDNTSSNLPNFYRFLELTLTTELLQEHIKEKSKILNYLNFEPIETLKGHENLKILIDAILLRRCISFQYTSFTENVTKNHEGIPCLLRRYQNRWYLIAKIKSSRLVTFGIDRISNLKITSTPFKEKDQIVPTGLDEVVGLNYSGQSTRVILEADPVQAKYLTSLPLHHSQKIVRETKSLTQFEYRIIPNYELVQAILKLGDKVKVIAPKELQAEVKETLQRTLDLYK